MLDQMMNRFPGQMIEIDAEGQILQFHRHICQNQYMEELGQVGNKLSDLWGEEPGFVKMALATGEPQYGERICRCDQYQHSFFYSVIPHGEGRERFWLLGTPLIDDVEREKMKQREIAESFLQQFMDIESGVLTMNDEEGRYFYANETALKLIGKPREEVLGREVGFYRTGFRPLISKAMEAKEMATKVAEYLVDGERRYYHLTALPILKDNQLVAGVTIGTDITDRVLIEKKLMDADRMYMIGEMAARIMHDIRNPLHIVKTSAQLLNLWNEKKVMEPAKVTAMLNNINTAVNNVVELMNDMLQFSKPSCDEKQQVNLGEVLSRIQNLLGSTMEKFQIQLKMDLAGECLLLGDEKLIRQGVLNIIQNAVDVLRELEGERCLEIRCREGEEDILLEIFNSGPIIDEQVRERIFDTFFSTKGKEGTGLGLAITKEIIERVHGGEIWCVSSEQNQGTSFIMRLPLHTSVSKATSQSI